MLKVSDEVASRLSPQSPATPPFDATSQSTGVILTASSGDNDITVIGNAAQAAVQPVVQGAVRQLQDKLSGDFPINIVPTLPSTLFTSPSLPIDARVSSKLREKILKNEFIDFGALTTNPVLKSKYQVTLQNGNGRQFPSLTLQPVTKNKKLLNITSWTSSFLIFVGVYTSQFPSKAHALMKYGEIIQDLAARGHDWYYYDDNFRYLRQNQPSAFPWG